MAENSQDRNLSVVGIISSLLSVLALEANKSDGACVDLSDRSIKLTNA